MSILVHNAVMEAKGKKTRKLEYLAPNSNKSDDNSVMLFFNHVKWLFLEGGD